MERKFISLEEKSCRVPLQSFQDNRSKEEIERERQQAYNSRNSFINPLVSKLDILKNNLDYVYVYLAFKDYIVSEDVQKCIKTISGENEPSIAMVSEDEQDLILKVDTRKIKISDFKWLGKYKQFFSILREEPLVLNAESYTEAFKELGKEFFKDDYTINEVIIILKNIETAKSNFEDIKLFDFLENSRLVEELGLVFAKISKPEKISFIRELKYVACCFLRNIEDIIPYDATDGKTNQKVKIIYNEKELKYKPHVCIIDCGISNSFYISSEKKLPYLSKDLLDHGTQVASICVGAEDLLTNKDIIQRYPLYSYKISDGKKENIIEGLINAINEFYNSCKLFVLSYNFYEKLEPILIHYISRRLDNFIHEKDIILITSTGNNSDLTIKDAIDKNYLNKSPILFPSNCKNVFSTGGLLEYGSSIRSIAPYTRHLPYLPDLEQKGEEFYILKPNIYVFGGGVVENQKVHYLPSLASDNCIVKSYGTSLANALLGYMFLVRSTC